MRKFALWFVAVVASLLAVANAVAADKRPNIIFILADDPGWGDLGW